MGRFFTFLLAFCAMSISMSGADATRQVKLSVIGTTDVHGNLFPYDFITREPAEGSLARVATYVDALRDSVGAERVILLDNGDILQGQPTAYYYNFIDTATVHPVATVMNRLGYDAATIGNHDVETGHAVYDRWHEALKMPLLGANIINERSGEPYLQPYDIIERDGVRIAIVGLLTPAIPAWLPHNLWEGLQFEDMVEAARRVMPAVKAENPDLIIGLFHSGKDADAMTGGYRENAALLVAREVPGFDAVFFGHDHTRFLAEVEGPDGASVVCLNPGANARAVARLDAVLTLDADGRVADKSLSGRIVNITGLEPDKEYMAEFAPVSDAVDEFVSRQIATADGEFSTRDAFFGPSAFMTLLHNLQLEISGADISFAAPLSFDARIAAGPVRVSDMFKLYKYENMLYTMKLTGREIKDYLEESYSLWTARMESADDPLLLFADGRAAKGDYAKLRNPSYNFDSAAGIDYTVDVTRPRGEKITITGFSDGRSFSPDSTYTVAVNSYRGNGGGDLLTRGAGIPAAELPSRIIRATPKDLRFYLIQALMPADENDRRILTPTVDTNWRFIPEAITIPAARRDRTRLFPD